MIISRIELTNFRSYEKTGFNLSRKTIIAGDNGAGKTNILEAIYMLATGKSFRADSDSELIRYGQQYASVQCAVDSGQLRIFFDGRKRFEVNGVPRRLVDFAGKLKAVLFGPAEMEIVTGSPSKRRKYLDFVIGQKDREYRRSLLSYEKGLRQRNRLLDLIREGTATRQQLWFWDRLLIKEGNYLTLKRGEFLAEFNDPKIQYTIFYDKSVISEARIKQYENEEVAVGNTLVGPHRDDFIISVQCTVDTVQEYKDVNKFGSRGQQRMAILALKIYELNFLSGQWTGDNWQNLPVLLLDDVFSELDHTHRNEVLSLANKHAENGGQIIMTTADEHLLPDGKDWNIISL